MIGQRNVRLLTETLGPGRFVVPLDCRPGGLFDFLDDDALDALVAEFAGQRIDVPAGFPVRDQFEVPMAEVVNRSLTYGSLSLAIAALYAVTVGGVGAMLESEGAHWLPWVAAAVVAVSFAPLRDALQRLGAARGARA